jgi:SAM-dependent methyltransferase
MADAAGFNAWHADVAKSPSCNLIFRRALGLPSDMVSNSLLPWAAVAEVAAALRLAPGRILVDLGCGRGGYGREVARRTGARLVGLDYSSVAVAIAASGGQGDHGRFCVADFTALGLADHSADAVMCIDAIQFSDPPLTALRECRRILADGGRLAVTAWEPVGPADEQLPERTRRMNLARDLDVAGFEQVKVTSKPGWYADERKLWQAAVEADANGDPALVSLQHEGTRALATFDVKRRILATAAAPASRKPKRV